MKRIEKRLEELFGSLSPEELFKLVIDDCYKVESGDNTIISKNHLHELVQGMQPEEGQRYNALLKKSGDLIHMCRTLNEICMQTEILLLKRDRVLWVRYSYIVLGDGFRVAGPRKKTNPFKIRGVFGEELIFGGEPDLAETPEHVLEVLDSIVLLIRNYVADLKAMVTYLGEEAGSWELDLFLGMARMIVEKIRTYDRPYQEEFVEYIVAGVGYLDGEGNLVRPPGAFVHVPHRLALVWEEVPENEETARRIREDPEHFVPASWDGSPGEGTSSFLELVKKYAAKEGPTK